MGGVQDASTRPPEPQVEACPEAEAETEDGGYRAFTGLFTAQCCLFTASHRCLSLPYRAEAAAAAEVAGPPALPLSELQTAGVGGWLELPMQDQLVMTMSCSTEEMTQPCLTYLHVISLAANR